MLADHIYVGGWCGFRISRIRLLQSYREASIHNLVVFHRENKDTWCPVSRIQGETAYGEA